MLAANHTICGYNTSGINPISGWYCTCQSVASLEWSAVLHILHLLGFERQQLITKNPYDKFMKALTVAADEVWDNTTDTDCSNNITKNKVYRIAKTDIRHHKKQRKISSCPIYIFFIFI